MRRRVGVSESFRGWKGTTDQQGQLRMLGTGLEGGEEPDCGFRRDHFREVKEKAQKSFNQRSPS